jgi:APA family basic amino acid/polyamine antiporter
VLEYAVGAATVAIAWSEYFNKVLELFNIHVPYQWSHSPLEVMAGTGVHGVMNVPALFILLVLSVLLARGTQESAFVNTLIVIMKVTIVMIVIVIGWGYINPAYHTPYIPPAGTYTTAEGITHDYGGIMGILGAAGVVFFAFIGFDAVSTAAQEARNPKRDMPIGILGSLVVCTVLYVLFAHVLSGVAPVEFFRTSGQEASVAQAILQWGGHQEYAWLANFVSVAILAGFSSVILVMLLGQSRVFYSMSLDGLVPSVFSELHRKYQTPYKSNMLFFVLTGLFGAFLPESIVGEMTSIGTLFAFILVCAGVWILRVRRPDIQRGFTVPALPVVAVLGIVVCGAMIYGLGWTNWLRLIVWLVIGLVVYFGYGRTHSRLEAQPERVANVRRG